MCKYDDDVSELEEVFLGGHYFARLHGIEEPVEADEVGHFFLKMLHLNSLLRQRYLLLIDHNEEISFSIFEGLSQSVQVGHSEENGFLQLIEARKRNFCLLEGSDGHLLRHRA